MSQADNGYEAIDPKQLREQVIMEKGRGLNSIPVRFALMSVIAGLVACAIQLFAILELAAPLTTKDYTLVGLTLLLPAGVTFFAATKLTGMIHALRNSTIAILEGEIDSPVDIDCACEVGGLADSFRAMVARLNSNILRMNILAYTDSVTGLPNRAVINHVLELARERGPENCEGSMFFIDLDGFKRINDTYGHDAGDELLRMTSRRIVEGGFGIRIEELDNCTTTFGELCQACPTSLVFSRFAGDEFVALLPGPRSQEELQEIGERILAALTPAMNVFGNEIRIGASIGIASVDRSLDDPRDLLLHSDIAMYRAKQQGRNCIAFFDIDLKSSMAERAQLEEDLRAALASDDLMLNYQPKICARTNTVMGVEALARWFHPSRGAISPEVFVPIAEQTGSMAELGETVLRLATRQGRMWSRAGHPLPISINVSAVQFESPDLVKTIMTRLNETGLDPTLLELEVTESLAMSDYTATKRLLDALRSEGIRVAIDDFGTGYSNFSQLARLNFDQLKIDRTLVSGIGRNGKSEAMLEATISMAHTLGYQVVAEGVETLAQMQMLKGMGCDLYQGYYLAQPMMASDLSAWKDVRTANGIGDLQDKIAGRLSAN